MEGGSPEIQNWICLIQGYQFAEEYETALYWAEKASARFPESAALHIYMGDLHRALKHYDDAFRHWRRALEMEPEWLDSAYSMGFCYEELEAYEKAAEVWERIAHHLSSRGFDAEVTWPREQAEKCRMRSKR